MKLWGKCIPILAGAALVCAVSAAPAQAQATGTVAGTVVDATSGRTLESAQVYFPALNMGGLSNRQGRFLILNVPTGAHELRTEIIGYSSGTESITVTAGQTTTVEVRLNATALRLQELVVTGVAGETPRIKLAFTVEKLDFTDMPVPAASADGLIQGKVAGVKVQSSSGKPGDASQIMLRGPTTITGSQTPLIIIDGVITDNTMADIDALDVESIEIVKGAAAASLYGSRASNGVINIRTRRGAGLRIDQSRITVRNEYGEGSLVGRINLSLEHPFKQDASGNYLDSDGNIIDFNDPSTGNPTLDDGGTPDTAFQDNPYTGTLYDQLDRFFDPGRSYTNYIAVEGRTGVTNYRASFSNSAEAGVIQGNDGFDRRTFRLNLDHQVRDNFDIALNTYYVKSHQDESLGNAFFNITFMGPQIDLSKRNPNDQQCRLAKKLGGCLFINPDPRSNQDNPLYTIENLDRNDDRQRFMAAVDARWSPASWFDLEANYSVDRFDFHRLNITPLNYANSQEGPNDDIVRDKGQLYRRNDLDNDINASITASFNRAFGDLTSRTKIRYLLEDQHSERYDVTGDDFTVGNVFSLDNIAGGTSGFSEISDVVSQGYFFISALDYQGKYMGDFLVRRDGSSLFGPKERWQTYFRASAAWRLAQEDWWPIDVIDEFKLRYSIGTAGGRPRFSAQYETYNVSGGVIRPQTLGNTQLKPELSTEQEWGMEAVIAGKYAITVVYVDNIIEDQLLNVPLSVSAGGFAAQWQNAGTLESNTWEASLEAAIIDGPDMGWTSRVNFDRTRQEITFLNRPAYRSGPTYIREGESLGTFYGARWVADCAGMTDGTDCSQFQTNDDGYFVYVGAGNSYTDGIAKGLWGTTGPNGEKWGRPIKEADENGLEFLRLGSSVPDFNLNWGNTIRVGNLQVNVLFDGEFGADKYNGTRQWAMREWRHGEADQSAKTDGNKKPVGYYSDLYNVNADNNHYVEDGTYIKLREVALRYTLDRSLLERLGGGLGLESAAISLTGRNVFTWTDYQGYDPEVGGIISGADAYQYPNFRTVTAVLELFF